jgi:organic radical activating enzyme
MKNPEDPIIVKDKLDSVGCGFCLAKWTQVTIHLGSGINHSCHHVKAHKIDLEELKNNPNALHNTGFKKETRRQMLNGERPGECDYCWRIEDNTDNFSDRVYKSAEEFSWPDYETIKNSSSDQDFYPRYVEISFGNVCNFKCSYCGPAFSSKWTEEVKQKGPYDLKTWSYNMINPDESPIPEREHNPYIEAFWKWFPEAVKHMQTFRITGGEPLLSKHTKKVIQYLIDNPQPQLQFAINTNGCPPAGIWEEFTQLIKTLEDTKSIKEFTLYTSAESIGPQAEYSRFGMDWKQFQDNIEHFVRNTKSKISFMSAFNIFSLPTFKDFLIWVLYLKAAYHGENRWNQRILIDIPYVRNPAFLDVKIANQQLVDDYLKPALKFMEENTDPKGFKTIETAKLQRIVKDVEYRFENKDKFWKEQQEAQHMFFKFILQYDRRRDTNFLNTFPEYEGFFEIIKNV